MNAGNISMTISADSLTWELSDLLSLCAEAIEMIPEWNQERAELIAKHQALRKSLLAKVQCNVGK
jgi:hypothetical protein